MRLKIKMVLMSLMYPLVAALSFFVSVVYHPRVAASHSAGIVKAQIVASPMTSSGTGGTGISISGVLHSIWNTLVVPILNAFTGGISTIIKDMASGFGTSVITMFQNWSESLYGLGIWSPVIFVLVLAVAGAVIYFFFDAYGMERDALGLLKDI